jgi:hypothetical protein
VHVQLRDEATLDRAPRHKQDIGLVHVEREHHGHFQVRWNLGLGFARQSHPLELEKNLVLLVCKTGLAAHLKVFHGQALGSWAITMLT